MKMIMSLKKRIQGRISKMTPGAYNACFPIMYMRNPEKKVIFNLLFFGTDTGSRTKGAGLYGYL